MRTLFHPYLPNGLTGDPVLWVDLFDEGRAVLLDLGDLGAIPPRKLLRARRVVVTHTHLDHFIGFDRLLRLALGSEREVVLTGPVGFIDNVRGKLAGYTWNLIRSYPLRLRVEELDAGRLRGVLLSGAGGLVPEPLPDRACADGRIHEEPLLSIDVVELDHGVPVLGAALQEQTHLAVNKDRLERCGLVPGAWLQALKRIVRGGAATGTLEVTDASGGVQRHAVAALARDLLIRRSGQRLVYLTDIAPTGANLERATELARGAGLLVCEAAFLDEDADLAGARNHLTARLAGEIARAAGVGQLAPFHISTRYADRIDAVLEEASRWFGGDVVRLQDGTGPPPPHGRGTPGI